MKQIQSLQELKDLSSGEGNDFCIALNFGLRSSKRLQYDDNQWYVYNEIDDTEQVLDDNGLKTDTNIIEALDKGALFLCD